MAIEDYRCSVGVDSSPADKGLIWLDIASTDITLRDPNCVEMGIVLTEEQAANLVADLTRAVKACMKARGG